MARYFTWSEFDKSVDFIADKCKDFDISSIYGVPRGGLCLAVALSHKLNLKTTEKPLENSLIVDDIFETGVTLNKYTNIEGANFFVLFSKIEPIWWNTVHLSQKKEWIIFPWENKINFPDEQKEYYKKRSIK